jgi:hypothetical protein
MTAQEVAALFLHPYGIAFVMVLIFLFGVLIGWYVRGGENTRNSSGDLMFLDDSDAMEDE